MKLYCIPYSGGSASVYYKWRKSLNSQITLIPLEMAGRGSRIKESFYETIDDAAQDLSQRIVADLAPGEEYAIFGHSMGALVAFETYFALMEKINIEPQHIFFSGRKAPQDEVIKTDFYKLPEEEFMHKVIRYGGNTEEILGNESLMRLFVPILRNDFRLAEIYTFTPKERLIGCDYTVLSGTEDYSVQIAELSLWSVFATKNVNYAYLPGSHFFITENVPMTTDLINRTLLPREKRSNDE